MYKISVLVVENEDVLIERINEDVKKNNRIKLVGFVRNKEAAISILKCNKIDIVVLGLKLETDMAGGVELAKLIRRVSRARIIVLTAFSDIQKDLIGVGISGYLWKSQTDQVISTIENVYDGCYPYEEILSDYNKYRLMAELAVLTNAERMILKYLLQETSISRISIQCHTSENTVKKQINSIYRKLDIQSLESSSRSQLMERYMKALAFL